MLGFFVGVGVFGFFVGVGVFVGFFVGLVVRRSLSITQTFKMEFLLLLFCNTDMELEQEVGWKGEIISIPPSDLFLISWRMTHGRRLLQYECENY